MTNGMAERARNLVHKIVYDFASLGPVTRLVTAFAMRASYVAQFAVLA